MQPEPRCYAPEPIVALAQAFLHKSDELRSRYDAINAATERVRLANEARFKAEPQPSEADAAESGRAQAA